MGCGSSVPAPPKKSAEELHAERDSHAIWFNIVGPPGAGKSTFLNQCNVLYGNGVTEDANAKANAHSKVCDAVKIGVESETMKKLEANADFQNKQITSEVGALINELWDDADARAAILKKDPFVKRLLVNESNEPRSADAIWAADYKPTFTDNIIMSKEDGGVDYTLYVGGKEFKMMASEGLPSPETATRGFKKPTAVMFMADVSDFIDNQPKFDATLAAFERAMADGHAPRQNFILLNHRDRLEEKLMAKLGGEYDYAKYQEVTRAATEKFMEKFKSSKHHQDGPPIVHHFTSSTDTMSISTCFESCKEVVLIGMSTDEQHEAVAAFAE